MKLAVWLSWGDWTSGQRKHSKGKATGSNDVETFDVEIVWPNSIKTRQIQGLDLLK